MGAGGAATSARPPASGPAQEAAAADAAAACSTQTSAAPPAGAAAAPAGGIVRGGCCRCVRPQHQCDAAERGAHARRGPHRQHPAHESQRCCFRGCRRVAAAAAAAVVSVPTLRGHQHQRQVPRVARAPPVEKRHLLCGSSRRRCRRLRGRCRNSARGGSRLALARKRGGRQGRLWAVDRVGSDGQWRSRRKLLVSARGQWVLLGHTLEITIQKKCQKQ